MAEFNITSFFGRIHPALVHLPIGILLLAFLFELLSKTKRYKKLKAAVRPALFFGMLSSVLSATSGYILSQEGGYDDQLLTQHKWLGFATAGLAFIVYLFSRNSFSLPKDDRKKVVLILFFPLVILVLVTGHWGGSLTRGEGYLFESSLDKVASNKISAKRISITNVDEARVFDDVIQPLLEEKCYACHSSKKQKGQLRLDAIDLFQKGGKHGEVLVAGDPEESELFKRITLSVEEKEHMPPRKEPQLTSNEIELIRWWITEGASFDKKVKEFAHHKELTMYLKTLASGNVHKSWVPDKEVGAADQLVIKELSSSGVAVATVAANSNYLAVSFAGKKKIEQRDLELLNLLSLQVIDLNLSWTSVSDKDLARISSLKELRVLNLGHTAVTNAGISVLNVLTNLFRLNLVETKVDNEVLKSLIEMKALKELYVFQTNITKEGISTLNSQIKVDTGKYQLPHLVSDTVVFRKK